MLAGRSRPLETQTLRLIRKRVTAMGPFCQHQLRAAVQDVPCLLDRHLTDLLVRLETELLCQSVANQTQEVSFLEYETWWDHLKHTILKRWFGDFACERKGGRIRRWLGRRISVGYKTISRTVQWELLEAYPKADIVVPELGEGVPLVVEYQPGTEETRR